MRQNRLRHVRRRNAHPKSDEDDMKPAESQVEEGIALCQQAVTVHALVNNAGCLVCFRMMFERTLFATYARWILSDGNL